VSKLYASLDESETCVLSRDPEAPTNLVGIIPFHTGGNRIKAGVRDPATGITTWLNLSGAKVSVHKGCVDSFFLVDPVSRERVSLFSVSPREYFVSNSTRRSERISLPTDVCAFLCACAGR
jgi:hypothetical protein